MLGALAVVHAIPPAQCIETVRSTWMLLSCKKKRVDDPFGRNGSKSTKASSALRNAMSNAAL